MSKKKRRQLLGLLAALCAAVLLLLCVVLFNRHQAAKETADAESSQISTGLSDDPVRLSWSQNGGTVELVCDSDGNWSWAEDSEFPLNASLVQSLTSALKNPAVREMDMADTAEAYGLAEPSASVETEDADGTTARLLIGGSFTETDTDGSSETYYYAQREGSDKVLQLDAALVSQLTDSIYDLAQTSQFETLSTDQVTSLSISGSVTTSFTVQAVDSENDDGETETEYHWYCGDTDVTDASLLGSLRAELLKNPFTAMADWKPDDAALVRYGLDQPITVTVNYTDSDGSAAARTLLIGSLTGEGSNYYCSPDGGKSVYLVGASSLTDTAAVAASGFEGAAEAD